MEAEAEAWQRCVDWFAYNGQRGQSGYYVSVNLIFQAEEANPYKNVAVDDQNVIDQRID